ncbi:MAG: RnfH family protein [Gammaproteobacteria bacterium]|nr:MAG: RnfH family protein [Gammaproteobacteria bacterium]
MSGSIRVEVAYALPDHQEIIALDVPVGTSMYEAAKQSGITEKFKGLDLEGAAMGIFGKTERKPKDRELQDGDRVEIYRSLIADPKEVRKRRAEEAKKRRE